MKFGKTRRERRHEGVLPLASSGQPPPRGVSQQHGYQLSPHGRIPADQGRGAQDLMPTTTAANTVA
jgi:hypothetical protein